MNCNWFFHFLLSRSILYFAVHLKAPDFAQIHFFRFPLVQLLNFTFDRWASHRSSARYIRHMLGIFQSSIVKGLAQPLISVAGVSTAVCLYEDLLARGSFPDSFPSFLMPTAPFDLTSFALSLLLVFRTNTSYDRWLEISTVWSGLANRSRDTMRQVISHLSDSSGAINPLAAAMCRWVVAYARSLKAEVTEGCDLSTELSEILTGEELKLLLNAHHRPSFALSVLTELGAAAPLRESHRIRLDENLTYFEDAVGSCERILRTPIPLSYTRHTSRFMVIWLSALPLGLYGTCSYATIPLTIVIAFLLLGIDEIGVQIEEPFGLLPLDDLCAEIEGDLFGILREAMITKRTAAAAAAAALGDGSMGCAPSSPLLPMQRGSRGRGNLLKSSDQVGGKSTGYCDGAPERRERRGGWVEFGGRVASIEKVLGSLDEDL